MAVNGITEQDWHLVKDMGEKYPSVVPNFGLHPWFIAARTPGWFESLKEFLDATPSAAVGEIGLDNSSLAPANSTLSDQLLVCRKQLELAKELNRPVTVHCLAAFDELLDMMKSVGPFPAGLILHSYAGSAKFVPKFAELGAYFSFSGHLIPMNKGKAKQMLKVVPLDRILLETDSPDGLPELKSSDFPPGTLNQPAFITKVLSYVASLLEMPEEELGELSYANAIRVFSFRGSKLIKQGY